MGSVAWRDVLAWVSGGVGALYLAGYLALLGYCAAYDVVFFPAVVDQQYLVLGARVVGTALYVLFLLSVCVLVVIPVGSACTRLARRRGWLPSWGLNQGTVDLLLTCLLWAVTYASLATIGIVNATNVLWFAALVACSAASVACLLWLLPRSTAHWRKLIASLSVLLQLLALPIVYGRTAVGSCRIYAEVMDHGSVVARGGVLSRTEHEVALLTSDRATLIVPVNNATTIVLKGMFDARTRAQGSCGATTPKPAPAHK